jgi:hypothetical protein
MATIETQAPTETSPEEGLLVTPSARATLIRRIADIVVLPSSRISANERAVAGDILIEVLAGVEQAQKMEIARRVATVADAPPALLRFLLLDEPVVARPLLAGLNAIPEALLIEAVRLGQRGHRDLIARRHDLTMPVIDALLEFNETDVARLILRREECTLSPSAVDILVARSSADADLQQLLLRRRELDPAQGLMMFWWVGADSRRRILARFTMNRAIIQDVVQDLYQQVMQAEKPDPVVKEILNFLERRHRPRGANGEILTMDVVVKALNHARRHHDAELVHAVSLIAGVSRDLAGRIVRDPGGEPFAVLCKSVGVARDSYFSMLAYDVDAGSDEARIRSERLLAIFDSMGRDFSRAALRYWDWRGNPRMKRIAQLIEETHAPV